MTAFQKTALVEGAGTGAGGILLGLADFPLLLSIKMKFLFEAAAIYGFNTKEYEERLFILHVFQLAFSSDEIRRETLAEIENWEDTKATLWKWIGGSFNRNIGIILIWLKCSSWYRELVLLLVLMPITIFLSI